MQKEYLLLRNNQETGPHSLEELVQLGLKPFDLIWVQGRSGGWSYPSEVEALKRYVPAATTEKENTPTQQPVTENSSSNQKHSHPHIFVSMPHKNTLVATATKTLTNFEASAFSANDLEARAEALRQRAMAFNGAPATADVATNYNRALNNAEEEYASWLYDKKAKKKKTVSGKQLVATVLITAGMAGAWWVGKKLFSTSAGTLTQQSEPLQQTGAIKTSSQNTAQGYPSKNEAIETQPIINPEEKEETPVQKNKANPNEKKKSKLLLTDSPVVVASSNQSLQIQEEPKEIIPENTTTTAEIQKPTVDETPKKKSGIGKIFAGIFGKKKQKQAEEETGERTAKRREEVATVNLINDVELKLKQDTDNWMMGVQNAEITLYNRSSFSLSTAVVEVSYLNEENTLLEKRTIHFNNIAAKKSNTSAVPPHRTAHHLNYKILSATGGGSNTN